ncbi:uncharacterized protein BDZ99DRAFT_133374 [Mytilinidion resinicola]|uniref:Uncharacterized protein n=1 Tax=Mytilinidion resinicola TaxID=574789 RepID=A0A6A6Z5B0_9PEZI|nr:uncharacterized protein BDZ99DRAFT_133374 [Mytilinidion resinicola]KAF2816311.1 hypothetical protein BDZ99DRAFT_133374 [Mytilinidion resinicola]
MCLPGCWSYTDLEIEDEPPRPRRMAAPFNVGPGQQNPSMTYVYYAQPGGGYAAVAVPQVQAPQQTYVYANQPAVGMAGAPIQQPNLGPTPYPAQYTGQPMASYGPYHHYHMGRTKEQVDMDNRRTAYQQGAYSMHPIAPDNPPPDTQFWCKEVDGEWTLRTFFTIQEDLKPGNWKYAPDTGMFVYIRK